MKHTAKFVAHQHTLLRIYGPKYENGEWKVGRIEN